MTSHSIKDFQNVAEVGATNDSAVAKLVKAWESKNARRALRGSALSMMAVSLAACGGSDSTDEEPVDPPVTVTPVSLTLTAGADILDANDFTTAADTVSATGDTFQAGDIILDATSGDGDTLTVALTGNSAAATVAGIENIVFNVTSFAAVQIDANNIANGTITVNNLQLAGITGADVNNAGNVTVVGGSGVTGTLDVAMKAGATTVVNSGAAATVIVDADDVGGTTTAAQTISVVAAGNIDLTATDAAKLNISGTNVTVTLNATSADLTTIAGSGAGLNLVAADFDDIDGQTVSGFASVSFTTNSDANGALDVRNISSSIILTDTIATDVVTVASGASITLSGADDGIVLDVNDGAATNSTNSSATVTLATASAAGGATIGVEGTNDTIGTLNVVAAANQTAGDLTVSNAAALTVNLSGSGNVDFVKAGAGATVLNASALTGALTASASANMLSITGGSGNDTITAFAGATLVGGAGNDTLVLGGADLTGATFSGFEILSGNADFKASQLSGLTAVVADTNASLDVISVDTATLNFAGLTFAGGAGDVGVDMTGATVDTTAILSNTALTITGTGARDVLGGGDGNDVINAGAGNDTVVGGAGNDNISGGVGDDSLSGGLGNDVISGGDGADVIIGGAGVDSMTGGAGADNFSFADNDSGITVATADVITDFTTASDTIDLAGVTGTSTVTIADGTAVADFTALVALADAALGGGGDDDVYVSYNALGTGNAYVFFDASGDGSFGVGDTLIILSGVNTATEIAATDFI